MIMYQTLTYIKPVKKKSVIDTTKPNTKLANEKKVSLRHLIMYDGWRVLYKLSHAAYIVHYLVIFWYYASIHSNGLFLC